MIKMKKKANFSKDKIKLFITQGYRIKVDKKSYMFFKKEEDYLHLFILEKVYSDFYNNLFSEQDEEIRSYFRMSLIKKYIESLPQIEIVVFYDDNKTENSFNVKFPNVGELNIIDLRKPVYKEIFGKLEDIGNDDLAEKYTDSVLLLEKKIKVKYIIKNERRINSFNRSFDARRK